MGNDMLEIPVIRVTQQNKKIYIGRMTASELVNRGVPTEWDPDLGWDLAKQGYQRAPDKKHFTRIAEFLREEGDPLLPTSALLAAREDQYGLIDFVSFDKDNPDIGKILLPKARRLFIVDYQHRWRGLQYAIENLKCEKLLNFQIPVIIMANVSSYEEIRQFYLINSKQKRVNTDLGLALLQTMASEANEKELMNFVGPGNKYRIRATRLTFAIAAEKSGSWVGKIIDPNMATIGNQVVSIKSFVDSLRPLLSRTSPIYRKGDNEIVEIVLNYWAGIERLMSNAFASPRNYSIQRAIGVFVMHRVAAKKIFKTCVQENDLSSTKIAQVLGKTKSQYLDENIWKVGGFIKTYSSASGQKELADMILSTL